MPRAPWQSNTCGGARLRIPAACGLRPRPSCHNSLATRRRRSRASLLPSAAGGARLSHPPAPRAAHAMSAPAPPPRCSSLQTQCVPSLGRDRAGWLAGSRAHDGHAQGARALAAAARTQHTRARCTPRIAWTSAVTGFGTTMWCAWKPMASREFTVSRSRVSNASTHPSRSPPAAGVGGTTRSASLPRVVGCALVRDNNPARVSGRLGCNLDLGFLPVGRRE